MITGTIIEAGDDENGTPRVVVVTTREQLRDARVNLIGLGVRVELGNPCSVCGSIRRIDGGEACARCGSDLIP
jgi:hypothetical protein